MKELWQRNCVIARAGNERRQAPRTKSQGKGVCSTDYSYEPRTREANVLCQQVLRSATGMAANYRAAGRSRSKAEFVAKMGVVIEEADETVFWLEMLADSGLVRPQKLDKLQSEANELLAIFAASRRTARD
ncbi:MAG TPA: four helix bundle protein [Candidatus Angelobacter sp.]|nr:four helix bundle protein [Candidatus Angelobacter sp.]